MNPKPDAPTMSEAKGLRKEKLTERLVRGLEPEDPKAAQEDVWDDPTERGGVSGLFLRLSGRTSRKTWMFRYRANRRTRRMKIGSYPSMTVEDARSEAIQLTAAVDRGEDPLDDRRAQEEASLDRTFRRMAEQVFADRGYRDLRETTKTEWARILESELLPRWGRKEATAITWKDVDGLVSEIEDRGSPAMAKNVYSFVRWLFRFALQKGFCGVEVDPSARVSVPDPNPGGPRTRYLADDEIRAFWEATEDETLVTKLGFRLGLLTAARFGNVYGLRFEDVERVRVRDFEGFVWKIPTEQFKGGRPHWVPLSNEALAVLEELRAHRADDTWAFPSREGTEKPYVVHWRGGQYRLRKAMGGEPWTAHDLRRTFRIHATQRLGIDERVADDVLGHADVSVGARHYGGRTPDFNLERKAEALREYGAWIAGLVGRDDG